MSFPKLPPPAPFGREPIHSAPSSDDLADMEAWSEMDRTEWHEIAEHEEWVAERQADQAGEKGW